MSRARRNRGRKIGDGQGNRPRGRPSSRSSTWGKWSWSIEPVGEGTSWKEFLDKKGEGVQHLGFQVVDPDKAVQALEKEGMPVLHKGR